MILDWNTAVIENNAIPITAPEHLSSNMKKVVCDLSLSLSLSLAWSHTKQNWGMRRNWVLPWSKILQFRPCQPYAWATCFTKRKGWVGIRFPCFRSWLWKALSAKAETRQQTTDVAAVSAAAALAARQEMTTNRGQWASSNSLPELVEQFFSQSSYQCPNRMCQPPTRWIQPRYAPHYPCSLQRHT